MGRRRLAHQATGVGQIAFNPFDTGLTQRMLTLTLRNLERDGLLVRHYFPEVPPRVEYQLTQMGASMLPALEKRSWKGSSR